MTYAPLRELPAPAGYGPGDVLVVFGELFGRGYVNGIVEEARRAGMTLVGATVGRRDADGTLRPLDAAELGEAERNLGGRVVNVPLEAGFDLQPPGDGGPSPVEQLKAARPDGWETFALDWDLIERSRRAGAQRFSAAVDRFVAELAPSLPPRASVLFVHTMAGGFPRARVYMPLLNRVFRGTGEKLIPSERFWSTDLGKLWAASFEEVTGRTFERLLTATAALRERHRVGYVAYGYHGCEVLVGGDYVWQSYVPYLQGWAKLLLERAARDARERGVRCAVFNCPEVWSGSSSLFLGVEVSLYPFLRALAKERAEPAAAEVSARCRALLREGASLDALLARAEAYLGAGMMSRFRDLAAWPHHSAGDQMDAMLAASSDLLAMSADPRRPVCAELSLPVVEGVGRLMFDASWEPPAPVLWLNHDVIARRLALTTGR